MQLKNIFTWVFIVCSLLLVVNIARNSFKMMAARRRIAVSQEKVDSLEKQRQQLLKDQARRSLPEYIEQQIRDKLRLVKPGEALVLLPSLLQEKSEENVYKYTTAEETKEVSVATWQEWINLFR
ncbi:MAG: FtsB family cell division protein [Patescibacteria group bacterium]|jgi:cell division protein FtsB